MLLILSITFLAILLFAYYVAKKRKTNIYLYLKQQWGKASKQKRDLSRVSSFFYYRIKEAKADYYVDEQTAKDLDIDEIFAEIDHTNSRIGQQVLYDRLRRPSGSGVELLEFDGLVDQVTREEGTRLAWQRQLNKLKQHEDYHIIDFLFFRFPPPPSWIKYISLQQGLFFIMLIVSFFHPLAVLLIMVQFCVNFVIHYRTKNKFHSFYVALGRIGTLYTVAKKIARSEAPDKEAILRILKKCKRVIRKFWVFDLNNLYYSEMTKPIGVAIELIKIATLMEVKATYRVCNEFNHYRDDLLQVYIYIGRLDAAISVGSYRRSLPYWCTPGLHTKRNYLKFEDVYHPLLKNGIANNLCNTGERSLFINGTNMSGKTTFMRTIGVNVLLARSIRTCLAKQAELSLLNVYSSIRIEDDVESGISYYFQELLRLREFVQTADQSKDDSLFLIDEILKGTNIYDRTKIARSILSYLTSPVHSMVIVTSHDIDLANQLRDIFDFYYFTETVNDTGMQFDYKIRKGLSTERNAVKLLSMLDFPKEIISKTK